MLETKLTVLITKDLRQQAKAAAAIRGETLSNVVRSALVEYVEETTRQDAKQALEIDSPCAANFVRLHKDGKAYAIAMVDRMYGGLMQTKRGTRTIRAKS